MIKAVRLICASSGSRVQNMGKRDEVHHEIFAGAIGQDDVTSR
jgi:hypothetical protein